jgi:hypothetical protein
MPNDLDTQWFFNALFTIVGTLGGWLLNSLREAIKDLRTVDKELTSKIQNIEVLIAGTYATRAEVEMLGRRIFDRFDRLEQKLDLKLEHKADK